MKNWNSDDYQGRSQKQVESMERTAQWVINILIITLGILILLG